MARKIERVRKREKKDNRENERKVERQGKHEIKLIGSKVEKRKGARKRKSVKKKE